MRGSATQGSLFAKLQRCRSTGEPLSPEDFESLMRLAFRHDQEYAREADSIIPRASVFLSHYTIHLFVRADLTVEAAQEIINAKRQMQKRLRELMPALFRLVSFSSEDDALGIISRIDDCHSDFPHVAVSDRQDKQRRQILESLSDARTLVSDTYQSLQGVEQYVLREFEDCQTAYQRRILKLPSKRDKSLSLDDGFSRLIDDLRICREALELAHHRASHEPGYLFLLSNQTKTHVVEAAHQICANWKGPPLVTTPGSDFSTFCSLLYEIVSGESDAGLSGAINRYSRSPYRKEVEEEAEHFSEGYKERVEQDNFNAQTDAIKKLKRKYDSHSKLARDETLTEDARAFAAFVMLDAAEEMIEVRDKEFGPFLVWAHQRVDDGTHYREFLERKERETREDIELGRKRRAENQD